MAYVDPEKEIVKRCEALIKAVNSGLEKYYRKSAPKAGSAKKAPSEKKGVEIEQISLYLSKNKATKGRTPEQQAEMVLKGTSWTCNSSHMSLAARDLAMNFGGKFVTNFSVLTKDKDKEKQKAKQAAYDEFVSLFKDAMKAQELRNYKKGKDFLPASADPLHMELPDSRLKDGDPPVIACLE